MGAFTSSISATAPPAAQNSKLNQQKLIEDKQDDGFGDIGNFESAA